MRGIRFALPQTEAFVTAIRLGRQILITLTLLTSLSTLTAAQVDVRQTDIDRLQDDILQASRDVSQMRSRDAALASNLQQELDDARDETAYLKVKLRKNEPIAWSEYSALRDRIDNIRDRTRGEGSRNAPPAPSPSQPSAREDRPSASSTYVSVGTEFDARLHQSLSSKVAQVEDRVEATTMVDLKNGDRMMVPAGAVLSGIVNSVNRAGRVERRGSLTIVFDRITIDGRSYPIRATVAQVLESEGIKGEAGKIGVGAGVGAILGAILGGAKGALAGVLIGGGGVVAATEGTDVELPAGTVLRIRLDSGLDLGS
jgi:hypothetical protein